jgi:hypothetical protein
MIEAKSGWWTVESMIIVLRCGLVKLSMVDTGTHTLFEIPNSPISSGPSFLVDSTFPIGEKAMVDVLGLWEEETFVRHVAAVCIRIIPGCGKEIWQCTGR